MQCVSLLRETVTVVAVIKLSMVLQARVVRFSAKIKITGPRKTPSILANVSKVHMGEVCCVPRTICYYYHTNKLLSIMTID